MDLEAALQQLEHHLAEARPVPLSASVMVNKGDVEQLIAALRSALPEEIRQARWVNKEREELLAQAAREAEQIVADGQAERERILSENELVRAAKREAERIRARAEEEARRLRLEAEDYIDGKLANFEVVLGKTIKTVEKGRERLRGRLASDELSGELPAQDGSAGPSETPAGAPAPPDRDPYAPRGPHPSDTGRIPLQTAAPRAGRPHSDAADHRADDRGVRFYDHEQM